MLSNVMWLWDQPLDLELSFVAIGKIKAHLTYTHVRQLFKNNYSISTSWFYICESHRWLSSAKISPNEMIFFKRGWGWWSLGNCVFYHLDLNRWLDLTGKAIPKQTARLMVELVNSKTPAFSKRSVSTDLWFRSTVIVKQVNNLTILESHKQRTDQYSFLT